MNDEIAKAANAFAETIGDAARAYVEFASAVIRNFAQIMKSPKEEGENT
jgi:hypothetical protein